MNAATALAAAADVLLTLCCECGTTRTVNRRAAGYRGNRELRCETCGKTTAHAAIGADPDGTREAQNRKVKLQLDVDGKLDVLAALGAKIVEAKISAAGGLRGVVGVEWDLESGAFEVKVDRKMDQRDILADLDKALEQVTDPHGSLWYLRRDPGRGMVANITWTL